MIEHTKEQIEQVRGYFQNEGYPLVRENVAGRGLEYFLLPQTLNEDLPEFIYRVTNTNLADYVLGVCESVPKELQSYFALAEYIEFKEKGLGAINRVSNTEEEILNIIPKELKKEYIQTKLRLFQRELYLDEVNPEVYQLEDEGTKEFKKAVNFLERELEKFTPSD
jgi:hypothetical protein